MTRQQFIIRTMKALCGDRPARPDEYYEAVRMADSLEEVYRFDKLSEE